MYAIVMAGGSGTRLWPLSRRKTPKQLLPLTGDASLLQQTVARLEPLLGALLEVAHDAAVPHDHRSRAVLVVGDNGFEIDVLEGMVLGVDG